MTAEEKVMKFVKEIQIPKLDPQEYAGMELDVAIAKWVNEKLIIAIAAALHPAPPSPEIHEKDLHDIALKASVQFNSDFVNSTANKFYLGFKEGFKAALKRNNGGE
jgi:hypothetical protein